MRSSKASLFHHKSSIQSLLTGILEVWRGQAQQQGSCGQHSACSCSAATASAAGAALFCVRCCAAPAVPVACGSESLLILLWPGLARGAVSFINLGKAGKAREGDISVSTEQCSPFTHLEKQKVHCHTSCYPHCLQRISSIKVLEVEHTVLLQGQAAGLVWTTQDSQLPCQSHGNGSEIPRTWQAQAAVSTDCVVFALTGKICQSSCLGVWEGEQETFPKQTEKQIQASSMTGAGADSCSPDPIPWRSHPLGIPLTGDPIHWRSHPLGMSRIPARHRVEK